MNHRKTFVPPKLNRADADPRLIEYHETGTEPKPTPGPTTFLPLRTRIATEPFSAMHYAQTHAYYEEIDTIPAASVNQKSEFSAGHWYVIHPLSSLARLDLSTRVLLDLQEWLEGTWPNELFVRETNGVRDFQKVRKETLDAVKRVLEKRREKGEVGREEGYVGHWEDVGGEESVGGGKKDEEMGLGDKGEDMERVLSRHTKAALAEAEAAGREAAEEARIRDEYEFLDC